MKEYLCINDRNVSKVKTAGGSVVKVIPLFGIVFMTTPEVAKRFDLIEIVHIEETVRCKLPRPQGAGF